ncbi:MAG TPA: DUF1559 domain-containing protein [Gemmataceae bacterium]|nr:DUF1559 domain-containing protein [Gemmataceae bacterium]
MFRRSGVTLLEVLLVVGILALLIGLILPAIQKVRESALRAMSQNNLHQLILGLHNYAAAHGDGLPGLKNWDGPITNADDQDALFKVIIRGRFLEANVDWASLNPEKPETFLVHILIDAADPSWAAKPTLTSMSEGNCSYAANPWAFQGPGRKLSTGFPDGTTQTIGIAEHYMRCGKENAEVRGEFQWEVSAGSRGTTQRRATFADPYYGDVLPRVSPGFSTLPTVRDATFQVAPALADCDPRVPQTPFRAGLIIAMMDGSVRTIKPGVDPIVFWAAVTPAGGESDRLD